MRMLVLQHAIVPKSLEAEHRQQEYNQLVATHDSLRTIQAALVKNGAVDINSVQDLVTRLNRVEELERSLSELRQQYSSLSSQVVALNSLGADVGKTLQMVSAALERAKQIDPNDPPALLKRALDIIDRLGSSTQPEQVKPLSQMIADSQIKQLAIVEADREKLRQQLDGFMRNGNGLTYPPCWPAAKGKTEYMFDVTAKDGGLVVRDAFPPTKRGDPAWKYVDSFPRDVVINERLFSDATVRLLAYSNQQNCRFYNILRDDTARESKDRYKQLRALVEGHFYVSIRNSAIAPQSLTPREAPVPQVSPGERSNFNSFN
jgi:hypothetical protein